MHLNGTAAWGGARLSDVLKLAGVDYYSDISTSKGRHVEFVSCDTCKVQRGIDEFEVSIALSVQILYTY